MNAIAKTKSFGFSLIELMFGIAIMIILTTVAVPSFQTWLRNSQIRNAAESIANGLQRARAEAVARNTIVEFVLGTSYVSGAGFVTSLTRPDLCPNFLSPKFSSCWVVRVVGDAGPPIDSRLHNEGSVNVTCTVLPEATTITFNSLGSVGISPPSPLNADGTAPFTQVDLVAEGTSQNLRVTIGVGGNARMCDPDPKLVPPIMDPPSPRAC